LPEIRNPSSVFVSIITDLKIESSLDLAMYLLKEALIAVVPGSVFGADGYIRISYATSMENLKETIYRLKKTLKKIE